MYVKGVLLGIIESIGKPHYKPILNFKTFESLLQHHLLRAKGKIIALDRGLKEAIRIHYPRPELLEAMKQSSEITQTIEEELNSKGESLNQATEIQLRMVEGLCLSRIAFSYSQSPPSRVIQTSKMDMPFGLGTEGLKIGDQIFAVMGCSKILILRLVGDFHMVNAKMFLFVNGIFLQDNLAMFPPGTFVDINLRYFYTMTETTLNCYSLTEFVLDDTIVFTDVRRCPIVNIWNDRMKMKSASQSPSCWLKIMSVVRFFLNSRRFT